MKLRRSISLYEYVTHSHNLRWWYGIAYCDVFTHHHVAYPVGLHWIVRAGRRLWEWSIYCRPSRLERLLVKAERVGFEHGRRFGQKEIESYMTAASKCASENLFRQAEQKIVQRINVTAEIDSDIKQVADQAVDQQVVLRETIVPAYNINTGVTSEDTNKSMEAIWKWLESLSPPPGPPKARLVTTPKAEVEQKFNLPAGTLDIPKDPAP